MTHNRSRLRGLAVLLTAGVALAGCGGSAGARPDAADVAGPTAAYSSTSLAATAATLATTATRRPPPKQPKPAFAGTAYVKLKSGYSFKVSYSLRIGKSYTNYSSDPPGYTSVFIPSTAYMSVTNTTPGRDISFGGDQGDDAFLLNGSHHEFADWDFPNGYLSAGNTDNFGPRTVLSTFDMVRDNRAAIQKAVQAVTAQSYFTITWSHQERTNPNGSRDVDTTAVCEQYNNSVGIEGDGTNDDVLALGRGTYRGGPAFHCDPNGSNG